MWIIGAYDVYMTRLWGLVSSAGGGNTQTIKKVKFIIMAYLNLLKKKKQRLNLENKNKIQSLCVFSPFQTPSLAWQCNMVYKRGGWDVHFSAKPWTKCNKLFFP